MSEIAPPRLLAKLLFCGVIFLIICVIAGSVMWASSLFDAKLGRHDGVDNAALAALYEASDAQREPVKPETASLVEQDGAIVGELSGGTKILVAAERVYVDGPALARQLGYSVSGEEAAYGVVSFNGDTVILPDGETIQLDVYDAVDGGVLYDATALSDVLGAQIAVVDGDVKCSYPYQTSRLLISASVHVQDEESIGAADLGKNITAVQYSSPYEAHKAIATFQSADGVNYAEPDGLFFIEKTEEEAWNPDAALSWGNDVVGTAQMQRDLVKKYGSLNAIPRVVVAVIDTGIDPSHPMFDDRLVQGYDFYENDDDPGDTNGHGSHVSGIIANNTSGNVKIMPLKTTGEYSDAAISFSTVYSSIEYAISNEASIVNMSFGGDYSATLESAISDACNAGVLMVAAHGNAGMDTTTHYPSSDSRVVAVSALSSATDLATYSNYGSPVELSAPGSNIVSCSSSGSYVTMSGTSMAAPFVAASAALIKSTDATLSDGEIRAIMHRSSFDLGATGWDRFYGYGRVDVSQIVSDGYDASIGATKYATLSAAVDAARDGDTIVVARDVAVLSPLNIKKNIVIEPNREQSISQAPGYDGCIFEVTGNLAIGSSNDPVNKRLTVKGSDGLSSSTLVHVAMGGFLSVGSSAEFDDGIIHANGSVAIDGDPARFCEIRIGEGGRLMLGKQFRPATQRMRLTIDGLFDGAILGEYAQDENPGATPFFMATPGFKLVQSGRQIFLAAETDPVARIGETSYSSLESAVASATDGDIIHITSNAYVDSAIAIDKAVSITSESDREVIINENGCIVVSASNVNIGSSGGVLSLTSTGERRTSAVIEIEENASLVLRNVGVYGFDIDISGASAIANRGSLVVDGASMTGNASQRGGAIYNTGSLVMLAGKIIDNTASDQATAIYNAGAICIEGGIFADDKRIGKPVECGIVSTTAVSISGSPVLSSGICLIGTDELNRRLFVVGALGADAQINLWEDNLTEGSAVVEFADGLQIARDRFGFCYSDDFYIENGNPSLTISGQNLILDRTTLELSEGWYRYGSCEYRLEDSTMTVRPLGNGEVGVLAVGQEPWKPEVNDAIEKVVFQSRVKVGISYKRLDEGRDASVFRRPVALFEGCTYLREVDLSGLDVSESLGLCCMFVGCVNLVSLDMSSLDVSNIEDLGHVFDGCSSLEYVKFPDFADSPVKYMDLMFYRCESLVCADLSSVDYSSVITTRWMFMGCCNLASFTASSSRDTGLLDANGMFAECSSLSYADLTGLRAKPVDMTRMFDGCAALNELDISSFDTSMCTEAEAAFAGCESLIKLELPESNVLSSCENMMNMFYYCSSLTTLDVSGLDTSKATNLSGMFYRCSNLVELDVSGFDTSNTIYIAGMFAGCAKLTMLDLSNWDISKAVNMREMFGDCSSLQYIDLASLDASNITVADSVFSGCSSLRWASLPKGLATIDGLFFSGCYRLTEIDIPHALKDIKSNALLGCNRLDVIYYPGTKSEGDLISRSTEGNDALENALWTYNHSHEWGETEILDPTCTEDGGVGKICVHGERRVTELIPALGHAYGEPVILFSDDGRSATATWICTHDASHDVTEACEVASLVVKEPTLDDPGETAYTATAWGDESQGRCPGTLSTIRIDIPAIGRTYGPCIILFSEDGKSATATWICTADPSDVQTERCIVSSEISLNPTCINEGRTLYTAYAAGDETRGLSSGTLTTTRDDIPALGHEWAMPEMDISRDASLAYATWTCLRDESHIHIAKCVITAKSTVGATCELPGKTTYSVTAASEGYPSGSNQISVVDSPALGHAWGEPAVEFSDDMASATATWTCANDASHRHVESCKVTKREKLAASCFAHGEDVYVATAAFAGAAPFVFEAASENTPARGHHFEGMVCADCGTHLGDVNGNGAVNIVDAQIAYDIAAHNKYSGTEAYAAYCKAADVTGAGGAPDGVVDAVDAFRIQYIIHYGWSLV